MAACMLIAEIYGPLVGSGKEWPSYMLCSLLGGIMAFQDFLIGLLVL
jgi:hypothetical protein